MPNAIVLIVNGGNYFNLFAVPFEEYPTGAEPRKGDLLPLKATKRQRAQIDGDDKVLEIPYLDGLYEVTEVRSGQGSELMPELNKPNPPYELNEDVSGFRVTLGEKIELDESMTPIEADVVVGLT